jgi:hypothetical protein
VVGKVASCGCPFEATSRVVAFKFQGLEGFCLRDRTNPTGIVGKRLRQLNVNLTYDRLDRFALLLVGY